MSAEKLSGAEKSKRAIASFKDWLIKNCQSQKRYDQVIAKYQMETGHAYRKLHEWLASLGNSGIIKIFENAGDTYIICEKTLEETKPTKPIATESDEATDNMRIKLKMMKGPCKNQECPPFSKKSCKDCSAFRSLKDKNFMEEE